MRAPEHALFADRLTVTLRWLALLGFALWLAAGGALPLAATVMLLLGGIWNLALTVLSFSGLRLPYLHPHISIFADTLLAAWLFLFSQGTSLPLPWMGFLPLITAAIYEGPRGGFIQAGVNSLVFGGLMLYGGGVEGAGVQAAVMVAIFVAMGGLLGYASREFGYQFGGERGPLTHAGLNLPRSGEAAQHERLKAIYNITSTLASTLNYPRVLELALDVSSSILSDPENTAARLVSAFLLFDDQNLRVGSARRFTPSDLRAVLPARQGLLATAIEEATPRFGEDPAKDPELSRIVALRACQSVYVYPLSSGLEVYGALLYGHPDRAYFTEGRREILEVIGRQAQVALVNARLYKELSEEKERMMEIQEEARKRLARSLHDGPTQSVAAIAMRVNFARRLMDRDAKSAGDELFKIEDLARRTTKEMRHMLFTLRPLVLESSGLKAALESMAEKTRDTYDENVVVKVDPEAVELLEIGKQAVIFYIAEESVNNARKHAKARNIWVRLKQAGEDLVLLEVEDDGTGFDLPAVAAAYESRSSLGMVNMRERTQLISGEFQIDSEVGKGTCVQVWVPVTEEAAEKLRHGV